MILILVYIVTFCSYRKKTIKIKNATNQHTDSINIQTKKRTSYAIEHKCNQIINTIKDNQNTKIMDYELSEFTESVPHSSTFIANK